MLDLLVLLKTQLQTGDIIAVRRDQLRCVREAALGLAYLESMRYGRVTVVDGVL